MPEPITALTLIAKKIAVDILTDPEKIIKYVFFGIILPILLLLLIFALPIILISNIPLLLFSGSDSIADVSDNQLQTIAIYQKAPNTINQSNLEWIDNKKVEYSHCDDIVVNYSFNLKWQHLMAIDSILLNQEFDNVDIESLINLSTTFFNRNSYTEEYITEETYEKEIGHSNDCLDNCEIIHTETDVIEVTKTRAYISIDTKDWEQMLTIAEISIVEDREIANNIFNTLTTINVEENSNIYNSIDLSRLIYYISESVDILYFNRISKKWDINRTVNCIVYMS